MSGFLPYIHQFRAVAILFVVASHTLKPFDWSHAPLTETFVSVFFGNGTLLFIFIAGFLFQFLLPKYKIEKYYLNKLKYVILPYIVVGAPAVALFLVRGWTPAYFPADFENWHITAQILWLYGTGYMLAPLWFVPMIAIVYALAPVLAAADRSGRIYRWLPLLFLAALFIPRPEGNLNPFQSFLIFLPIYLVGMWSAKNIDRILPRLIRLRVPLLIAWIALVLLEVFVFTASGAMYSKSIFDLHPDVISVSTIEKTLLCFILISQMYVWQDRIASKLDVLADMSFSVFFVHQYPILALMIAISLFDVTVSGNMLLYIAFTVAVIGVSLAVVLSIKRIIGAQSRFVVGS